MKAKFDSIMKEVREAANLAAMEVIPDPMYIGGYTVSEGVCGFAWVTVSGRGNFIKYIKDEYRASKNYYGKGFNIWYSMVYDSKGSQSYERHLAACKAAAAVLRKYGFAASASGRLD